MFRRVLILAVLAVLVVPFSATTLTAASWDAVASFAPQDDEDPRSYTVIKVKRAITVSGEELEDATIVIKDGKILAVGENVDYPYGAKVIDASDLIVMPGMINPVSRLTNLPGGGGATPHLDKSEDLTLTGKQLAEIASTGYTTLGLLSPGAPMPGRTLIIRTAGEKPADLVINGKGPVHVSFNSPGSSKSAVLRAFESAKKEIEKIEKAEAAAKKKASAKKPDSKTPAKDPKKDPKPAPTPNPQPKPTPKPAPKPTPKPKDVGHDDHDKEAQADEHGDDHAGDEGLADPKTKPEAKPAASKPKVKPSLEPLVDLLQKAPGATAIVEFGNSRSNIRRPSPSPASGYMHWHDIIKEYEFDHSYRVFNPVVGQNNPFFVTGETNVEQVAKEIGELKALVALYPNVNHHAFTRDKYNLGLTFLRHGARPVFIPENDRWGTYADMRDGLARMVRAGYPRSEILKTVTLHPAQMLGISEEVGTIEVGRNATLVFLSGDPLSNTTHVEKVMIDGKFIDMKKRLR